MNGLIISIKESYNELLHKVSWPSFPELLNSTTVVLIASAIIALVIFLMDVVAKQVLELIYSLGI